MRKLFNPEIFLDIARRIKDNKDIDEQGRFRTVIGRAYYAAFLTAREHLKKHKARSFNKDYQHKAVLDALDELDENNLKNWLDKLRDNRVKADYYLNKLLDIDLCEKCIVLSQVIINSIEGI